MTKGHKLFIAGIILFGILAAVFAAYNNRNLYLSQETAAFTIHAGEELQIRLVENPTTPYLNRRIDPKASDHVKLIRADYKMAWPEMFGLAEAGGKVTLTFKGLTAGVDTVRMANCESSILTDERACISNQDLHVENVFIITVLP